MNLMEEEIRMVSCTFGQSLFGYGSKVMKLSKKDMAARLAIMERALVAIERKAKARGRRKIADMAANAIKDVEF